MLAGVQIGSKASSRVRSRYRTRREGRRRRADRSGKPSISSKIVHVHMHVHNTLSMNETTPSGHPGQVQDRGSPTASGAAKRLAAHGWLYVPAISSPIGGGLIKLA